jgi:hypothetical protein
MKTLKKKNPDIQHQVPNNPQADLQLTQGKHWDSKAEAEARKKTLYDAYRTAAGHWKRSDEPDEAEQLRQSDRIQQVLRAQRQKASRERLKTKNAVPTKKGRKLFDEFMKEATQYRPSKKQSKLSAKDLKDLRNLYNAASVLEFDKWVFIYQLSTESNQLIAMS